MAVDFIGEELTPGIVARRRRIIYSNSILVLALVGRVNCNRGLDPTCEEISIFRRFFPFFPLPLRSSIILKLSPLLRNAAHVTCRSNPLR